MKALKCMMVGVALVGLLTLGAQAAHRPDIFQVQVEQARLGLNNDGSLQGAGGVRDLGNNCSDPFDVGTIGGGSTIVPYSVAGFDDDFDEDPTCPGPCGWYTDDIDGIMAFQVSISGVYDIMACDDPNDNSIQLRSGATCPGDACVAADDDQCGGSCAPPYQAAIWGVQLNAGTQYWLIIEFGIGNVVISGPCDDDSQCDDGVFCNGAETCVGGACVAGTDPCTAYQTCDEDNDVCVDPDPCIVWQNWADSGYFFRPGPFIPVADDWFLDKVCAGTDLIYYEVAVYGHPGYGCSAFNVDMELYSNTTCKICTGDFATLCDTDADCDVAGGICIPDYCPDAPIAGTACSFVGIPTGGWVLYCEPSEPVDCPDSAAPEFGIPDVWVVMTFSDDSPDPGGCSGPYIADGDPTLGWSDNVWGLYAYPGQPCCDAWGLIWFGGWPAANFVGDMCCEPCGPCCLDIPGPCVMTTEADCPGTYLGDSTVYNGLACEGDLDGDGIDAMCGDNCPDDPNPGQEDCNDDGEGDVCDPDPGEGDADGDGTCDADDGCPNDPNKIEPGVCGCGVPDDDTDSDGADDCIDPCPLDGTKWIPGVGLGEAPGQCGCGNPDTDTDGDGYADCIDGCPGVDNDMFPGCDQAIPTISEWGLVILALLLLVAGKVYFGRRATA